MALHEWGAETFVGDGAPFRPTLKRWAASGQIPARMIGGRWFVDLDAWEASTGDDLADAVLAKITGV